MPANVVVPEVGESIVDARVAKWLKKEEDAASVPAPPAASASASIPAPAPAAAPAVADRPAGKPKAEAATPQPEVERTRATPAARNVAQQDAVDLSQVRGSGEAGRVMKRDVEAAASKVVTPVREDRRHSPGDRTEERVRMS